MKLVTFAEQDDLQRARVGALVDAHVNAVDEPPAHVIDLQAVAVALQIGDAVALDDMLRFIGRGRRGLALAEELAARSVDFADARIPADDVRLLAPVPIPNSIRDCMEFQRHLVQSMRTVVRHRFRPLVWLDQACDRALGRGLLRVPRVWHQRPLYYKGNRRTVVGTDHPIQWPAFTEQLDFELEFGVFIGQGGQDIDVNRALDHIAGYTMFNDFSARDVQLREMQGRLGPAKGKDFETGNAMGPYLVTPEQVDEGNLSFEVRVNGQSWSRATTAEMKFSFSELIAFISRDEQLYPGDFIGSGTLPGGCGLELDRWIAPGDVVELDGGPLGVLRNPIVR